MSSQAHNQNIIFNTISISEKLDKESVYFDLENPRDLAKLEDPVLFFENNKDKCVILDEIQHAPHLFAILRSMVDMKREPARYILLGSASPELIRDSSETLAGRIVYEEMTPFNFLEVTNLKSQNQHWLSGGFPDACLAKRDSFRKKWLSSFIQTYIQHDLPMLGLDINKTTLWRFWTMLAHMHGDVLNMSNLAKSLGITSTTVKKYLSLMEGAFLIRLLQPYHVNIKKRLVKAPKVYIRDSGILHQLLSIYSFMNLESNPMLGNSWEGYAIEQITQLCNKDVDAFFYRTHEGAECDLVLINGGLPVACIEVKYSSAPKLTKGMRISFDDIGAKNNYVVTPDCDDFLLAENVQVCSLISFLTKHFLQLEIGKEE